MTSIVLDPDILAYPKTTDINIFESYIDRILDFDKLKSTTNITCVISNDTADLLVQENNFPYWSDLELSLKECGLSGLIQPQDVIVTLQGLLKSSKIEDTLGIKDILYDDVLIMPDEIEQHRAQRYLDELKLILMYICIGDDNNHQHLLATRKLITPKISVEGVILDVDKEDDFNINISEYHKKNITTFDSLEDLYRLLDPTNVWLNAVGEDDYKDAINIYLFQRTDNFYEDSGWRFGKEFFKTAQSQGFLHEESKVKSLIKSLGDAILSDNLRATHALRTGEGGNNPQVNRGQDKAWRRDIDYEYHLHYWEGRNEKEFASIVVHNDMRIPI